MALLEQLRTYLNTREGNKMVFFMSVLEVLIAIWISFCIINFGMVIAITEHDNESDMLESIVEILLGPFTFGVFLGTVVRDVADI